MAPDVQAAVRRCKNGDTESFGLLYDEFIGKIYRFVYFRVSDRSTAEDITSEAFARAFQNIGRFREEDGNFSAWLYRIAKNLVTDHYRRNAPASPLTEANAIESASGVEKEAEKRETVRKLHAAMAAVLSQEERELVTLRVWDDLSYADIAGILEKSPASCKMAFSRAVAKLSEKMAIPAFLVLALLLIKNLPSL